MLEALEVLGALDRQLRLMGETGEQTELPVVHAVAGGEHQAASDPVALDERPGGALGEGRADAGDACAVQPQ